MKKTYVYFFLIGLLTVGCSKNQGVVSDLVLNDPNIVLIDSRYEDIRRVEVWVYARPENKHLRGTRLIEHFDSKFEVKGRVENGDFAVLIPELDFDYDFQLNVNDYDFGGINFFSHVHLSEDTTYLFSEYHQSISTYSGKLNNLRVEFYERKPNQP